MDRFDVLLQRGELLDPASGRSGLFDVGFEDGLVVAIEERLDDRVARQVVDASGCLVVPGLIDIHAHVFHPIGDSVSADDVCLHRGTTTVVDGGSAGAHSFEAFRLLTVDKSRARVLAWLNLSTIGQIDTRVGELLAMPHADVDAAVATARAHPDHIVGFKARLSTYVVGGTCMPVLRLLRECADSTQLPIMVHIGDTGEKLTEILDHLRPGDIVTHIMTGRKHGILNAEGKIHPEVFEARERGVLYDASRGLNHEAFPVLQAAVEQGLLPDTVSTDVTRHSAANPDYGLLLMATHLLAFGVPIDQVLARITVNPAHLLGRPELGCLEVGGVGDACVIRLENGRYPIQDVDGRVRWTDRRLVPVGAVRKGVYLPLGLPASM